MGAPLPAERAAPRRLPGRRKSADNPAADGLWQKHRSSGRSWMTVFGLRRRVAAVLLSLGIFAFATAAFAAEGPAPKGRAVMAWHVTIAPACFGPSSGPAEKI